MIIDTHAHYDDEQFDEDREQLLVSLAEEGIEKVINVGASLDSCRRTLELTKQYPFLYAAIGVHPNEVGTLNEEAFAWLRQACQEEKVVAVGEI
ncbi:MAG TPA: hydrolase TatD, partial [Lachnospiraceae bacterium]|nr:hydrolase TatD [Lachnospiraceae bacterium]